MRFDEAVTLARQGELVNRPVHDPHFVAIRDGKTLYGQFVGETHFADMKPYAFTEEDVCAADWKRFTRTIPDEWDGCDAPKN